MKPFDYNVDPDFDTYKNPVEGKTYISPPIQNEFGDPGTIRIVTRGIDQPESYEMVKIKGEVLLRETTGGKNIITAKVFENSRKIHVLNIQQYTAATGNPHRLGFAFLGDEITKLFNFIRDVQTMRFGSERYQRLSDDDIEHLEVTDSQALNIFQQNQELFTSIIQSKITTKDIVAFAYRKKQLDYFERLLNTNYFDQVVEQTHYTREGVWQKFFESNQWIFGYGLGYIFLTGLDDKKLEQVVQGFNLNQHGKRIDAVMKTRGIISNLCFVEIKTHKTKLLAENPHRPGCFAPSKELGEAVSQIQVSTDSAIRSLSEKVSMRDDFGNPTGEDIYNFQARSFLVIGSLSEFLTENGVNEDKLRSFELFRKSIVSPEILTFDELYERARFIVEYNEGQALSEDGQRET